MTARTGGNAEAIRSTALDQLRAAPRVPLGSWPTPVEHLGRVGSATLWVKRDDLSAWGRGGAKARKLEYLIGHLQAHGYTDVVTVTGNVTNLVFDMLPALDAAGVQSRIFVVNYPHANTIDREATFAGVRDRVELLDANWPAVTARAIGACCRARLAGRRPFLLLPGAAHPACVIGNACGLIELAEQLNPRDFPRGAVVYVTVATGTTLAGFLLGAHAIAAGGGPTIRVVGVAVDRAPLAALTLRLIRWTERSLGLALRVPPSHVDIRSRDEWLPYARFSAEIEAVCDRVRRDFHLCLDPIFGGKTWYAMERTVMALPRCDLPPIVYWHCGFTPEWRALSTRSDTTARTA